MTELVKTAEQACEHFQTDLVLYHYGKIDATGRWEIERHLQDCPGCRIGLEELKRSLANPGDDPPQEFWNGYLAELQWKLNKIAQRGSRRERIFSFFNLRFVTLAGAAAVLLLALAITLERGFFGSRQPEPDEAMIQVLPIVQNLDFFESMPYLESMEGENTGRLESSSSRVSGDVVA